jgi:hypothetical protein
LAVVREGNICKHFILGMHVEIIVPELQLLHDVETHWDSIFFMIRHLRVMCPVSLIHCFSLHLLTKCSQAINHFLALPLNKDLMCHRLSDIEWGVLQDFKAILAVCSLLMCVLILFDTLEHCRFHIQCNRLCHVKKPQCWQVPYLPSRFLCLLGNVLQRPIPAVRATLAG